MLAVYASQFGLVKRCTGGSQGNEGDGDGNGVIEGNGGLGSNCGHGDGGCCYQGGETEMFWGDLAIAGFVEGAYKVQASGDFDWQFNSGTNGYSNPSIAFPYASIGNSNSVYVFSDGATQGGTGSYNYFGISVVTNGNSASYYKFDTQPGLSVSQAYNIDKKMDDGLPETGYVTAQYVNTQSGYASHVWVQADGGPTDTITAITPSSTTCYDNGGSGATPRTYSLGSNGGSTPSCALSFRFQ